MTDLLKLYLENVTKDRPDEELELEAKFGTYGVKPITRINYEKVIQKLLASGFQIFLSENLLRIQNEYTDTNTGVVRLSTLRTEISGLQNIRVYCQTNSISTIEREAVKFIQKVRFGNQVPPANVNDFNFRLALSKEIRMTEKTQIVKDMLNKWKDYKKSFRYLKRFKLSHPAFPFILDLSIVKESKKQGNSYITHYDIHDSGVFSGIEKYEIEIECVNRFVGLGTSINTVDVLNTLFKKVIKYVLSGIQETNYPVSYPEQYTVLQDYMRLLWGKNYQERMRITPKNYVGPSSYTLERKNIYPVNPDSAVPNIREHYTVTDKADGERKLLFIAPNGKIYLINTNMNVQFTGTVAKNIELWNSLIDGEHILFDKRKNFINMYAAFDIYYIKGEDVRARAFVPLKTDDVETNFRLPLLQIVINKLNVVSVVDPKLPAPLKVTYKNFHLGTETKSIFQCCAAIMKKDVEGIFEYATDGLIFTPASYGVGANKLGEVVSKPFKKTWKYSFKWKPAEFNTIDFLVSLKKNENGTDFIGNLYENGMDTTAMFQVPEYKTAILRVGFNEGGDGYGYLNPYQDTLADKLPSYENEEKSDNYLPTQFFPTSPSDNKAGICNIRLRQDNGTEKHLYTEENEIIEDNTIVEFKYEKDNEEQWRWVPLRVRYDKTAQFRDGEKMFGNDYIVANSNWHSIHYPITRNMIITGENIPQELIDDDVYYNKASGVSKTRALRDFHNLYVKKYLINTVAKPGGTLIDLAVGKGGDFPKWIDAKLKFVFGVDLSRDNIQNRMDGAYARYLNFRKEYKVMPAALFVNGNSSVNIRSTQGVLSDKDKQITKAVFGQGPQDAKILGAGVFKQYGVAAEGFDVCSVQFAIHYMFETQETLQNFLQNVSEVTKVGGYFIGTSYDGEKIFNMLKTTSLNESKILSVNKEDNGDGGEDDKKKIWGITKKYAREDFPDDNSCVGYAIDVFQETINQTIREYLVNFSYLTRVLENYGFVPVSNEELKKLQSNLPNGNGQFSDLFNKMNEEIKAKPNAKMFYGTAHAMSPEERIISFLNHYFVYKKVRNVSDVEKVSLQLQDKTMEEKEHEEQASQMTQQYVKMGQTEEASAVAKKGITKIRVPKSKTKAPVVASAAVAAAAAAAEPIAVVTEELAPPNEKATIKKLNRTLKLKPKKTKSPSSQ